MPGWQKALAYGVALVAVLAVAIGVGRLVGPIGVDSDGEAHDAGHGDDSGHGDHERISVNPSGTAPAYELELAEPVLTSGTGRLEFRILDEGEPVTSYELLHERRLHLIAVRRDLSSYRHVHPRLDPSTGTWTVPVDLEPGSWRLYADFQPQGGEQALAEADLSVGGNFRPQPLGPDRMTSFTDGYEVHLTHDPEASTATFHVTRDGSEVTDLQPYLGAYGHLVAIAADDLAYLHVHPEEGEAGPQVAFHAEFPDAGRYRLFLDFRHGGQVHTADFTITGGARAGGDHDHGGDESTEEDGDEHSHDH